MNVYKVVPISVYNKIYSKLKHRTSDSVILNPDLNSIKKAPKIKKTIICNPNTKKDFQFVWKDFDAIYNK